MLMRKIDMTNDTIESLYQKYCKESRTSSPHLPIKILCLCPGGSCRSVAMVYELRDRFNHDALHASMKKASLETISMLYEWADIVIVSNLFDLGVSRESQKTYSLELGKDVWRDPMNRELRALIRKKIMAHASPRITSLIPADYVEMGAK